MNTVTLPQSLLKRIDKLSAEFHTTPAALIKNALVDRLDYEEWKLKQIDAGLAELKAGKGIPNEEFWASVGTVKNARKKAA
jgi:predicted transcriptional regulator